MQHYTVTPQGVCPTEINFDLDGEIVRNISFTGGCNGNLKAVSKLVDGMTVQEINDKLRGNLCRDKGTSCADQLAKAVAKSLQSNHMVR